MAAKTTLLLLYISVLLGFATTLLKFSFVNVASPCLLMSVNLTTYFHMLSLLFRKSLSVSLSLSLVPQYGQVRSWRFLHGCGPD